MRTILGVYSKKRVLILLPAILLIIVFCPILCIQYLSKVKICEPVEISVEGISEKDCIRIAFYGHTPLQRILRLQYVGSLQWAFKSYGSFIDLRISGDQSVIEKISRLNLSVGSVKYTIQPEFKGGTLEKYNLVRYIDPRVSKMDIVKSILHWNVIRFLVMAAGILLLVFLFIRADRRFAIRHNLISLRRNVYPRIKTGHSRLISIRLNLFKPGNVFLFCLFLVLVYIAWFFPKTDYSNK